MKKLTKPEQNINFLKNQSFESNEPIFQDFEAESPLYENTKKSWVEKLLSVKIFIVALSFIGIIALLLIFVSVKDKVIPTSQSQPSPTPIPTLTTKPGFLQELKNDQKVIEGIRLEEDNLKFPSLDWDIYISP